MKDRQKIFLDRVVKLLVTDTIIDYDKGEITYPFTTSPRRLFPFVFIHLLDMPFSPSFYKYCKNSYGLTDEEIDYVWDQYKSIIRNKIKNNER